MTATDTASLLISPTKKNKIHLEDYNYQLDIENRLMMSQFTHFDVEVLDEILNNSLRFSLNELASDLDVEGVDLLPILEKFARAGLLQIQGDRVLVDKEMRKYYELQMMKFDDNFVAGMEFLQLLLRKVPIHVLPSWYMIPRSSDSIFDSLVEKYFLTPQVYERYLAELQFEDPILTGIMEDVFASPELKVRSRFLREKYGLTREQFEYYMLHLELNFVCCLSYNQIGDAWKEVVTPFHEWREYLQFKRDSKPQSINDPDAIAIEREDEFAFVKDMKAALQLLGEKPLALESYDSSLRAVPKQSVVKQLLEIREDLPSATATRAKQYQGHFSRIMTKLCLLKLAENEKGKLVATEDAAAWMGLDDEEFALQLYRHPGNTLLSEVSLELCTHRNVREIEKGLEQVSGQTWFSFDSFIRALDAAIGQAEPVTLKRKGRHWRYVLPVHGEQELSFVHAVLFERFAEVGILRKGEHDEQGDCFSITAFGETILGLS